MQTSDLSFKQDLEILVLNQAFLEQKIYPLSFGWSMTPQNFDMVSLGLKLDMEAPALKKLNLLQKAVKN